MAVVCVVALAVLSFAVVTVCGYFVLRGRFKRIWKASCFVLSLTPILCVGVSIVALIWAGKDALLNGTVNGLIVAGIAVGVVSSLLMNALSTRGRLYRGALLRSLRWGRPSPAQQQEINRGSLRITDGTRVEAKNAIDAIIRGHV
jgi:hypothetical protein